MLRGGLGFLAALATLLASACSDDEPTKPDRPPIYLPRTSPENVLENLATAHRRMDINGYDAQFHEQFRFLVSPYDDIGVEYFDRIQDHESTERMFDNIDDVEIALANTGSVPSESADPEYSAATGHRQISVPSAFLQIQTREMQGGEPVFLMVPGHPHRFIFRPDSTANPATWTIVLWEDQNTGFQARDASVTFLIGEADAQTEDTTWSTIKNLYRGFSNLAEATAGCEAPGSLPSAGFLDLLTPA
jgi:hypothetical protein